MSGFKFRLQQPVILSGPDSPLSAADVPQDDSPAPSDQRDGRTHYEGCWTDHHDCALARIDTLQGELDKLSRFTQADIDLLRRLWANVEESGNPVSFEESKAADLAARIRSTLPRSPGDPE